jgi:hypothetical protein
MAFMLPEYRQPKAWLDAHQGGLDAAFLVAGTRQPKSEIARLAQITAPHLHRQIPNL